MSYIYLIKQLFEAFLYTTLLLFVGLSIITIYFRMHNKQINWLYLAKRHRSVLFAGFYYGLLLRITCFSRVHYQGINLRLFASYENAWFAGSAQAWQQLFLNLLMMMPLGMVLPFVHRRFKRWYVTLITLFAGSLVIECIQLVFHLGVFETDDLFNNTLGGFLGFCVVMMIWTKKNKRFRAMAAYAVLPLLSFIIAVISGYVYWSKPYGNLPYSVFRPYPMNAVKFTYHHKLSDARPMIGMYRLAVPSDKQIHLLIRTLEIKLKLQDRPLINEDDEQQVRSYADAQLVISKLTGSWSYDRITDGESAIPHSWEKAKSAGEKLGLIDAEAKPQKQADTDAAVWKWKLDGMHNGKQGTLSITCTKNGIIDDIDYDVNRYTFVRKEKAISPKQAYAKLKRGEFRASSSITEQKINFENTKLAFRLDSKDYLQPVYLFAGKGNDREWAFTIPALP